MRSCAGESGNASLSVERPPGVEAGCVRAVSRGSGAEWMAGFESFMLGWTAFLLLDWSANQTIFCARDRSKRRGLRTAWRGFRKLSKDGGDGTELQDLARFYFDTGFIGARHNLKHMERIGSEFE